MPDKYILKILRTFFPCSVERAETGRHAAYSLGHLLRPSQLHAFSLQATMWPRGPSQSASFYLSPSCFVFLTLLNLEKEIATHSNILTWRTLLKLPAFLSILQFSEKRLCVSWSVKQNILHHLNCLPLSFFFKRGEMLILRLLWVFQGIVFLIKGRENLST